MTSDLIDLLIDWDTTAFVYLHQLGSPEWDWLWVAITRTVSWVWLYALLIFYVYKYRRNYIQLWIMIAMIGIVVGLCDWVSVHGFKLQFERLRPTHAPTLEGIVRIIDGRGGLYGFVSSHATNVFGIATLMCLLIRRRWTGWLWLWAGVVSYSRIYLGRHYPLDLICGGILGGSIASGVYYLGRWGLSQWGLSLSLQNYK